MNSWGQKFADGGFFSVNDASVLNSTKFYDVYWTLKDLKKCEIEAYKIKGIKKSKELSETFPSINELAVECPECKRFSKVVEFTGHLLEAVCPKCRKCFQPTNRVILNSLYARI